MVELVFQVATAVALIAIAVFEIVQLARRRHDLPLRVLVPGVTVLALVVTFGISIPPLEPIDEALETIYFSNVAWMVMAFCFAAFFMLANTDQSAERRRKQALVELGVCVLAIAVMYLVTTTAPPGTWHTPRLPEDYRTWRNIVFYVSVDGYALAAWGLGTLRAIRYLRALTHRWARGAVVVVLVGAAAMALGVDGVSLVRQGLYLAFPGSDWPALKTVYNTGRLGGQIVLAVGLALAPLATALVKARSRYDRLLQRRLQQQMAPLWGRLVAEFPYIVLPRASGQAGSSGPDGHDLRFERVTTEITDGLARLAPFCDGPSDGAADPRVAADLVVVALEARQGGRGEDGDSGRPATRRIEPDFADDWRARAGWMIKLERELEHRGVITRGEEENVAVPAR